MTLTKSKIVTDRTQSKATKELSKMSAESNERDFLTSGYKITVDRSDMDWLILMVCQNIPSKLISPYQSDWVLFLFLIDFEGEKLRFGQNIFSV